jgi:hypothetical protein
VGVRSVDRVCEAAIGSPCKPNGDHLDRYIRAAQQGRIARETLKQAVARLTVISPQAIVLSDARTASGESAKPSQQIIRGRDNPAIPAAHKIHELEAGA